MQCYICDKTLKREHTLFCGQKCMMIAGKRGREEMEEEDPLFREMLKAVARNPEAIRQFSVQDIVNMSRTSRDFWKIFAQNNYVWYVMAVKYLDWEDEVYNQNVDYLWHVKEELGQVCLSVTYSDKFEMEGSHELVLTKFDLLTGRYDESMFEPKGLSDPVEWEKYMNGRNTVNLHFDINEDEHHDMETEDWDVLAGILNSLEMTSLIDLLDEDDRVDVNVYVDVFPGVAVTLNIHFPEKDIVLKGGEGEIVEAGKWQAGAVVWEDVGLTDNDFDLPEIVAKRPGDYVVRANDKVFAADKKGLIDAYYETSISGDFDVEYHTQDIYIERKKINEPTD